jgi:alcohol dehydrogenase
MDTPKRQNNAPTDAIVKIMKTTEISVPDFDDNRLEDDPAKLITHHFKLDQIMNACDTFGHAAKTNALKVIIQA